MPSRRQVLASATGALPLAAGCISAPGSSATSSCPETTTTTGDYLLIEDDPAREWKLGERIENPDPYYQLRYVAVANFDVEREVSITVTRDDEAGPVLDRTVTLDVAEYAAVKLVEPDVWTVEVTLPDGSSKSHTPSYFDCNSYTYGIAIRCGGRFSVFGGMSAAACPEYPLNESRDGSGSNFSETTTATED